jgi:hypothetical protein
MAIIEMRDGNIVAVRETVEQVRAQLEAAGEFAMFSGTNGAAAPINPAFVVDLRDSDE